MRDVLSDMPYALIAVEDIVSRAEISRATFYRHFTSKFAVGKAIHDEFWPHLFELYSGFLSLRNPSDKAVARWLRSIVDYYQTNKPLAMAFQQMVAIEPEFQPITDHISIEIIRTIANSSPKLKHVLDETQRGRQARVEARLFLEQLDDFCYAVAVRGWMEDPRDVESGVKVMCRNFRRLIEDLAGPESPAES